MFPLGLFSIRNPNLRIFKVNGDAPVHYLSAAVSRAPPPSPPLSSLGLFLFFFFPFSFSTQEYKTPPCYDVHSIAARMVRRLVCQIMRRSNNRLIWMYLQLAGWLWE